MFSLATKFVIFWTKKIGQFSSIFFYFSGVNSTNFAKFLEKFTKLSINTKLKRNYQTAFRGCYSQIAICEEVVDNFCLEESSEYYTSSLSS